LAGVFFIITFMNPANEHIICRDLFKIFKVADLEVVALRGLDLVVNKSEVVALVGASGSGKSTILSLIAGLLKPTSGEVIVDNKRISKLPDHFCSEFRRDNIGFIFQRYNLIASVSVKENVLLPLLPKNLDREILEEKFQRGREKPKARGT